MSIVPYFPVRAERDLHHAGHERGIIGGVLFPYQGKDAAVVSLIPPRIAPCQPLAPALRTVQVGRRRTPVHAAAPPSFLHASAEREARGRFGTDSGSRHHAIAGGEQRWRAWVQSQKGPSQICTERQLTLAEL